MDKINNHFNIYIFISINSSVIMEENNDNLVSDNDENNTEIADSDAISIRSNEENIEDSDDTAINNFPIRHYKDFIFEGSVENYDDEM